MLLNRQNPHGGDIYKNRVRYDFSANINPAGMPEAVKDALIRSAERASVYPDPYCTALREAVGAAEGISPDRILCGCGAAELIYSYAYALRSEDNRPARIVSPSFSGNTPRSSFPFKSQLSQVATVPRSPAAFTP